MLNCSLEKKSTVNSPPSKTLITSFIPRQLSINFKSTTNMNPSKEQQTPFSLSSQQRLLLLNSISQFLEQSGFSKTLQKFRKEARIEKDGGGSCSLSIEEMCYEYLKSRDGAKEAALPEQATNQKGATSGNKTEKMKDIGGNEGKKSEPTTENGTFDAANVKSKKNKKSKSAKDASEQVIEETQSKRSENPDEIPLSLPSEPAKKAKDKKKTRKDKSVQPDVDPQEKQSDVAANNVEKKEKKEKKIKKEANGSKKAEENATDLNGPSSGTIDACEKKESKKRKKPLSEENGGGHVEEATLDASKRRKTDNSDQSNGMVQPPKTPDGFANGAEKNGKEKFQKQDKTKELNGSAEPRTAKAFQRVKPEEVEFADERLQDNSYWAKDGADSGYGAKAQEVLGQVRGRDFRHEKTKKKRGSYRGGQIDLHTHSVKFNYEDEDE